MVTTKKIFPHIQFTVFSLCFYCGISNIKQVLVWFPACPIYLLLIHVINNASHTSLYRYGPMTVNLENWDDRKICSSTTLSGGVGGFPLISANCAFWTKYHLQLSFCHAGWRKSKCIYRYVIFQDFRRSDDKGHGQAVHPLWLWNPEHYPWTSVNWSGC